MGILPATGGGVRHSDPLYDPLPAAEGPRPHAPGAVRGRRGADQAHRRQAGVRRVGDHTMVCVHVRRVPRRKAGEALYVLVFRLCRRDPFVAVHRRDLLALRGRGRALCAF